MKRYKKIRSLTSPGMMTATWYYMVEDPNGEWVRYGDVVRNDEEGFVYFGDKKIGKIKEMELSGQSSIECNCAKRADNPSYDWWVCPAHGYKRR